MAQFIPAMVGHVIVEFPRTPCIPGIHDHAGEQSDRPQFVEENGELFLHTLFVRHGLALLVLRQGLSRNPGIEFQFGGSANHVGMRPLFRRHHGNGERTMNPPGPEKQVFQIELPGSRNIATRGTSFENFFAPPEMFLQVGDHTLENSDLPRICGGVSHADMFPVRMQQRAFHSAVQAGNEFGHIAGMHGLVERELERRGDIGFGMAAAQLMQSFAHPLDMLRVVPQMIPEDVFILICRSFQQPRRTDAHALLFHKNGATQECSGFRHAQPLIRSLGQRDG